MATATRGRLALAQESRVCQRREREFQDDLVKKYYAEQRNADSAARDALKAPVKRREREAKERQAEIDMLESMYRTEKHQELAQLRTAEESDVATAVLHQHAKEQRERGEIADLHAKHETLRDLASKLKTAQVTRERHLQLQEKTILENQAREYDSLFADKLEKQRQQAVIAEDEKQHLRRMDNFKAREKLEEQMEDRRKQEEIARAEFERDRELVDAVMAAIDEEDRLHGEFKRAKAAETRRYIADFIADRDARREAERRAEFESERKIQEHLQEVKRREEAQQAVLAAKREEADRIYTRLKAEKEAAQAAQDEQDFLVNLLQQEEVEARQRQKEQDMRNYRARIKKEMIAANKKQMELKAAAQAAAAAEEDRLKQSMLAKFAEDDRLEQMNAQKRRMRALEHRKEAERMVAEKRALFEAAQRGEAEAQAARIAREERELSLVERERRRLLRDATELLDYLPKGVLRNRDDLDYMLSLAQELKQKGRLD